MELDEVLHLLGDWGRYQIIAFTIITIAGTWFPAWQIMGTIFIADSPNNFSCNVPEDDDTFYYIPDDGQCLYSRVYTTNNVTNGSFECSSWTYHQSYPDEKSAVSEYDLICGKKYLSESSQSVYFAGVLVGAFIGGQMSDIVGRKTVFMTSLFFEGVLGILTALSWNYFSFVSLWFLVGVFENGINIVQYILVLEMYAPKHRTLAGAMNNISWGIGVTLLAPICYFFKDWRTMMIIISIPPIIFVLFWFFILESPRWLLSRNRDKDAKNVIKKIEKFNGVQLPSEAYGNLTATSEEATGTETNVTFLHVFTKRRLLMNSLVMFYCWLVNSLVYYGLSYSSSYLVGNKYMNFFLLAVVEIPAYLIITYTMMTWGRRLSMVIFFTVAGVASIVTAFLPEEQNVAVIIFAMLGKLGITCSFGVAFLYGTEIFPTVIRNVGFGLASLSGRIGGILAPLVFILGDTYKPAPLLIFGIASFFGGAFSILLPETLGRPLPETLDEANNLHLTPRQDLKTSTPGADSNANDEKTKTDV